MNDESNAGQAGRGPEVGLARRLGGWGVVLLFSGLLAAALVDLAKSPVPDFDSLTRVDGVFKRQSSVPHQAYALKGAVHTRGGGNVVDLSIDGQAVSGYVNGLTADESARLYALQEGTPVVAWHDGKRLWQLQGPAGMIFEYRTHQESAARERPDRVKRLLLGVGLLGALSALTVAYLWRPDWFRRESR